jgi:hypothetical protein
MDSVWLRARAAIGVVTLWCLLLAVSVSAQTGGTGTITGTVYDNAGVVPGANVTVTNTATGTSQTTPTNEVGIFRFTALAPGPYTVKVELQGFRTVTIEPFNLLAETRDFPRLVLEVGGVAETVSVSAEVTPVQVATSSRQQGGSWTRTSRATAPTGRRPTTSRSTAHRRPPTTS